MVYRGALPYCTACGKIRAPLTGPAVHLTGKPSRIGGQVTRLMGWLTLALGSTFALFMGGLFYWIFPTAIIGWVLGIGLLAVTFILAFALLKGGSVLRDS